ncbi:MAG: DUF1501 domain-containing protein [Planctomycetia bacterium]|nr:DUF1501 domain-containing protein [Planctomycetia bacterium]
MPSASHVSPALSPLTRREALRLAAAGVGSWSCSQWLGTLAAHAAAAAAPRSYKSCILLWMDGGPSHIDTFDPKPDAPADYRGPFGVIDTSVPGLRISEAFPQLSKHMHRGAVLRGMSTTEEAEHFRARYFMHVGFRLSQGGLTYPSLGALVSAYRPPMAAGVPNFVVTGKTMLNFPYVAGSGYLGPRHQALILPDVARSKGLPNAEPATDAADFADRLTVLEQLSREFQRTGPVPAAATQQTVYRNAVELIRSGKSKVFDVAAEPLAVRERYGTHQFGQGCLLARRLVEAGVPFVEIYQGDWDTHEKRRTDLVKDTLMPQVDQALPALLEDLQQRGLLHETLVIWMGEFGRTPKCGADGSRNHYVKAWSTVLFGGGIRAGQAVGRTDAKGATVEERPVSGPQFMATVLGVLGIDPKGKQTSPGDRPVHIVDQQAEPVQEVLG